MSQGSTLCIWHMTSWWRWCSILREAKEEEQRQPMEWTEDDVILTRMTSHNQPMWVTRWPRSGRTDRKDNGTNHQNLPTQSYQRRSTSSKGELIKGREEQLQDQWLALIQWLTSTSESTSERQLNPRQQRKQKKKEDPMKTHLCSLKKILIKLSQVDWHLLPFQKKKRTWASQT